MLTEMISDGMKLSDMCDHLMNFYPQETVLWGIPMWAKLP